MAVLHVEYFFFTVVSVKYFLLFIRHELCTSTVLFYNCTCTAYNAVIVREQSTMLSVQQASTHTHTVFVTCPSVILPAIALPFTVLLRWVRCYPLSLVQYYHIAVLYNVVAAQSSVSCGVLVV